MSTRSISLCFSSHTFIFLSHFYTAMIIKINKVILLSISYLPINKMLLRSSYKILILAKS